jgi:hypothetical protein
MEIVLLQKPSWHLSISLNLTQQEWLTKSKKSQQLQCKYESLCLSLEDDYNTPTVRL